MSLPLCTTRKMPLRGLAFLSFALSVATAAPADQLTLHLLNNTRCLDGTNAGFYFKAGSDPSTVVVYLQGGGACTSKESCAQRAETDLGSSKNWAYTIAPPKPILSPDASINPDFATASKLYVPYGTGDVHSGGNMEPGAWGFTFAGHVNFAAIVANNADVFATAKSVLLTGASAGGFGTFYNADYLASQLPATASLKANPVAGWFFPGFAANQPTWEPVAAYPAWIAGVNAGPLRNASTVALWNSVLNPDCVADQAPADAWHCGTVTVMYPYIKTPLLVFENQVDAYQLFISLLMPQEDTADTRGFTGYFAQAMTNSTAQVRSADKDALFLAGCLDHVSGLDVGSGHTVVQGYNTTTVLGDWFFSRGQVPRLLTDLCPDGLPCNPTCTEWPPAPSTVAEVLHAGL